LHYCDRPSFTAIQKKKTNIENLISH
jgi:hypothetical protein